MKLSEIKRALSVVDMVRFKLPNGELIPSHFHVTEVGKISKQFVDCGGTMRNEEVINFQLWTSTDFDHRLSASKLQQILEISESMMDLPDAPIEVEYQENTIGKFGLEVENGIFLLTTKQTACLAEDHCGIPVSKPKVKLGELQTAEGCCGPGSSCC